MPGVEDYISCPLEIIQGLFDKDDATHLERLKEYFGKRLAEKNAMSWVPSLNDVPLHNLRTNTLVRFRCMVQDMYDPEFYLGVYIIKDTKTGETQLRCGKYKDIAESQPGWEIDLESPDNRTMDRQTLYCVPIAGENAWVKHNYASTSQVQIMPSSSAPSSQSKRPREEETMDSGHPARSIEDKVDGMDTEAFSGAPAQSDSDRKKPKTDDKQGGATNSPPDLNFPLPGENGPAVLIKVYGNSDMYKVNDVVEFVGVLSNDPAMVSFTESEEQSAVLMPEGESMDGVEETAHCPPPSLVPRLHVILAHPLKHNHPDIPADINADHNKEEVRVLLESARQSRENLLSVLEQAFLGDKLTAEFVLAHLLSNVYARHDVVALGKFALNVTGCPQNSNFTEHVYKIIQELTTRSHLLSMTLDNMNNQKFMPRKDYAANRLSSGILQLSETTQLMLDETAMHSGQLDANGVHNVTALGNLIRWQKVEYDFNYHKQDFMTNVKVLVLSEGKSLLPCDCQVVMVPHQQSANLDERFGGIDTFLTPAMLTQLRTYMTLVQLLNYSLPEGLQKDIEEDFVAMRKADPTNMTVDGFHTLLVLARLLTLSFGQTTLTREIWEHAKRIEGARKLRLAASGVATSA